MKMISVLILLGLSFGFLSSCAPVKFSKANTQVLAADCTGVSCNTGANAITCNPKINGNLVTFTYASLTSNYPSISSNCNPSDVTYSWEVKKADLTPVATSIPGLTGANPTNVNMTVLGQGAYYVYLTATKSGSGYSSYVTTTPLEFVVPGPGVTDSLTCDPRLNGSQTSVTVGASDNNPSVSANCVPNASTYAWSVTKNDVSISLPAGLSGANSTPNFKALGAGTYKISLQAMLTGSTSWRSSNPLVVTVTEPPQPTPAIQCNPRINGTLTSITLTGASAAPLVSANCLPSNVQYTWTVTKNGSTVSVPGLSGANSNPNFQSLGVGTYQVSLRATSAGYTQWNTTSPLVVTVQDTTTTMTINCSPRLNGTAVAVSVATNGTNPVVTSNCSPSDAALSWKVLKAGQQVTIAGLSGASSTGQFIQAGVGTYDIYLTATKSGYNAFVSVSPLQVTVTSTNPGYRLVVNEKTVGVSDNKVDIILVIDDSNSMLPENTKLAQRLEGFVNSLSSSGLDWQMCATVTRYQYENNVAYWGLVRRWTNYIGNPDYVLKPAANNISAVFADTIRDIGAGWAETNDERGIKAAWWNVHYRAYNSCYRADASVATILISDEDVRSVGGNQSLEWYGGEYKPLEADDYPQQYVNKMKQDFGANKRFTFNSIIVKPGDAACMSQQDQSGDKSHYGYKYQELSQLTGGGIGSICDSDYSSSLYFFKDKIVNTMSSMPLECAPVGSVTVTVTPTVSGLSTSIVNNTVVFNPVIPAGRTVRLEYKCSTM